MILKVIKYIFGSVIFLFLLSVFDKLLSLKNYGVVSKVDALNYYCYPYDLREQADSFYEKKKNSLDVVFLGSSLCFCNINPNVLWNEYGIASCDFAASSQDLGFSYYYMKELFRRQKPKLIVVETGQANFDERTSGIISHFSIDPMRFGVPKIEAIFSRVKFSEMDEMFFDIVRYHSRWAELSRFDYEYLLGKKRSFMNGNESLMGAMRFSPALIGSKRKIEDYKLKDSAVNFMFKMNSLAKKNGANIFFIFAPILEQKDFDSVRVAMMSFLNKNNLDCYDFTDDYEAIGTDFSTDYHDVHHMTYWGNVRFSKYLGKVLKERYDIPDRRGEDEYKQFDIDCQAMFDFKKQFDENYKREKGVYPNPKDYE